MCLFRETSNRHGRGHNSITTACIIDGPLHALLIIESERTKALITMLLIAVLGLPVLNQSKLKFQLKEGMLVV